MDNLRNKKIKTSCILNSFYGREELILAEKQFDYLIGGNLKLDIPKTRFISYGITVPTFNSKAKLIEDPDLFLDKLIADRPYLFFNLVNEAYTASSIRRCVFFENLYGKNWFFNLYKKARTINPNLSLFYCDFGVWNIFKWNNIENDLIAIYDAGNIDGVNIQTHIDMFTYNGGSSLKNRIRRFRDKGIRVWLGEITVFLNWRAKGDINFRLKRQAEIYRDIVQLAIDEGVEGIGFTSPFDRYSFSWVKSFKDKERTGLFNIDLTKKLSYDYVLEVLK